MRRFEWIQHPHQISPLLEIWREVFHTEQGIELAHIYQKSAGEHHYVILWEQEEIIGCGRLSIASAKAGRLSRIAVRKSYRGQGLGRQIIDQLEKMAQSFSLTSLQLTPHLHLESFYASLGYRRLQEAHIMLDRFPLLRMGKKF
ncbi:MAG: GNAT family N-acetyltransferase [Bacteroidota bacterium]